MYMIGLYISLWHDSILLLMTTTCVLAVNYYTGTCEGYCKYTNCQWKYITKHATKWLFHDHGWYPQEMCASVIRWKSQLFYIFKFI